MTAQETDALAEAVAFGGVARRIATRSDRLLTDRLRLAVTAMAVAADAVDPVLARLWMWPWVSDLVHGEVA